jgi:hypothetical protein
VELIFPGAKTVIGIVERRFERGVSICGMRFAGLWIARLSHYQHKRHFG